jgi:hypothetical protein
MKLHVECLFWRWDTRVFYSHTEPLENQFLLRGLFNASLSNAEVIKRWEDGYRVYCSRLRTGKEAAVI